MQFSRDPVAAVSIRRIERGEIVIGDVSYRQTVAVTVDRVIDDWRAVPVTSLDIADLEGLLADEPEMLLLGTGWAPAQPPRELVFALARRGIGLEVMDTPAACRTFNILVGEGRRPSAVLTIGT